MPANGRRDLIRRLKVNSPSLHITRLDAARSSTATPLARVFPASLFIAVSPRSAAPESLHAVSHTVAF
jgi:hypothetical protein